MAMDCHSSGCSGCCFRRLDTVPATTACSALLQREAGSRVGTSKNAVPYWSRHAAACRSGALLFRFSHWRVHRVSPVLPSSDMDISCFCLLLADHTHYQRSLGPLGTPPDQQRPHGGAFDRLTGQARTGG